MMIRRKVKLIVLGALAVLALPTVSSAQMSRVEGMALQGDYIKDWSGIFTYTSQVANVGNLVYGELGNVASPPVNFDRSVGAVVGNLWEGRLGTWAIHLHEMTPSLGQGNNGNAADTLGGDPNVNSMESFDIMWGKKFGTKSLGLRLNKSTGSTETSVGGVTNKLEADFSVVGFPTFQDPNRARNIMGFGAGLGFEVNPTTNVETSFEYQTRTWKQSDPGVILEEDGAASYQFAARAMWQWQPNIMVVPVFKYYNHDMSWKQTSNPANPPADTTVNNTIKGWQVGGAGNWTLGSNDLFVLGLTFAQNKLEQEEDVLGLGVLDQAEITETFTPQLFAALETHVNSWLTLRFGANKGAWEKIKLKRPNGDKFELQRSTFNMNLGAGLKFGNLQLDAVLDNSFPNHLPYFISGDVTTNTFTKVTASYPW